MRKRFFSTFLVLVMVASTAVFATGDDITYTESETGQASSEVTSEVAEDSAYVSYDNENHNDSLSVNEDDDYSAHEMDPSDNNDYVEDVKDNDDEHELDNIDELENAYEDYDNNAIGAIEPLDFGISPLSLHTVTARRRVAPNSIIPQLIDTFQIPYGGTVTVDAGTLYGHSFLSWSIVPTAHGSFDDATSTITDFTLLATQDVEIAAFFHPIQSYITIQRRIEHADGTITNQEPFVETMFPFNAFIAFRLNNYMNLAQTGAPAGYVYVGYELNLQPPTTIAGLTHMPSQDIFITALFEPSEHDVTVRFMSGTTELVPELVFTDIQFGSVFDLATEINMPTIPGYTFIGWTALSPASLAIASSEVFTMTNQDVVVIANFIPDGTITHTVSITNYPTTGSAIFGQSGGGIFAAPSSITLNPGTRPGYAINPTNMWTVTGVTSYTIDQETGVLTFTMPNNNVNAEVNWVDASPIHQVTITNRVWDTTTNTMDIRTSWTYTGLFGVGDLVSIHRRTAFDYEYTGVHMFTPGGTSNISAAPLPGTTASDYHEIMDLSQLFMPFSSNTRPEYFFRMPNSDVTIYFNWSYAPDDNPPPVGLVLSTNQAGGHLGILPFGYNQTHADELTTVFTLTNHMSTNMTGLGARIAGLYGVGVPELHLNILGGPLGTLLPPGGLRTLEISPVVHPGGAGVHLTPGTYSGFIQIYRNIMGLNMTVASHPVSFEVRGFTVSIVNDPVSAATLTGQTITGTNGYPNPTTGPQFGIHSTINVNAGTRQGYQFNNWTAAEPTINILTPANPLTALTMTTPNVITTSGPVNLQLTANWDPIQYAMTVSDYPANLVPAPASNPLPRETSMRTMYTPINLAAGTVSGWTFMGWMHHSVLQDHLADPVAHPITSASWVFPASAPHFTYTKTAGTTHLVAAWGDGITIGEPNRHTITVVRRVNNNQTTDTTIATIPDVALGSTVSVNANIPEFPGHTFQSWSATPAQGSFINETAPQTNFTLETDSNTTIIAHFAANTHHLVIHHHLINAVGAPTNYFNVSTDGPYYFGQAMAQEISDRIALSIAQNPRTGFAVSGREYRLGNNANPTIPAVTTMPDGTIHVTVLFTPVQHNVTVQFMRGATQLAAPEVFNNIPFGTLFNLETEITTSIPAGHTFAGWTVSAPAGTVIGSTVNGQMTGNFTMPAAHVTLIANFALQDDLTIDVYFTIDGGLPVHQGVLSNITHGLPVTAQMLPIPGHSLYGWSFGGTYDNTPAHEPEYTITGNRAGMHYTATVRPLSNNVTVTAHFAKINITVDDPSGNELYPGSGLHKLNLGTGLFGVYQWSPAHIRQAVINNETMNVTNVGVAIDTLTVSIPAGAASLFRLGETSTGILTYTTGLIPGDDHLNVAVRPRDNHIPVGTHTEVILVHHGAELIGSFTVVFTVVDTGHQLTIVNDPPLASGETITGQTVSGAVNASSQVTLNAGTRKGYIFTHWTVVAGTITPPIDTTATSQTFDMPAMNVTLQANWVPIGDFVETNISSTHLGTAAFGYTQGIVDSDHSRTVRVINTHETYSIPGVNVRVLNSAQDRTVSPRFATSSIALGTIDADDELTFELFPYLDLTPGTYTALIEIYQVYDGAETVLNSFNITFEVEGFTVIIMNSPGGVVPGQHVAGTNFYDDPVSGHRLFGIHSVITVTAGSRSNFRFNNWTSPQVSFANNQLAETTFEMINENVIVWANWSVIEQTTPGSGGFSHINLSLDSSDSGSEIGRRVRSSSGNASARPRPGLTNLRPTQVSEITAGDRNDEVLFVYEERFSASIPSNQLGAAEGSSITVLLEPVGNSVHMGDILVNHIIQQDSLNQFWLEQLYTLAIFVDGQAVNLSGVPITIEVNVSGLNLSANQKAGFTGFVFDEALQSYRLVPGVFSADGNTFIFQVYGQGIYGVMITEIRQVIIRLLIDDPLFTINGVPHVGDSAPFIDPSYNRTMVPLRMVAEALGAQVNWIEDTETVVINRDGITLILPLNESLPNGMGTPMLVGARTFVPVAYVSQMLEADVRWDGINRAVYITRI